MTQNFQPSPAPATSSEGASSSPRFVNRPDPAEGCTQLSEESNYKETLDFLERVENWYSGTWPGCSDTNKMKKEIYNKLSCHLKTELVDFDVNTNTYDELKKSIMARIERKYASKIRLLSFLTETKQQGTQTLSEYLTLAHREAAEAGLYSQGWTISDLEVIILLAGMKNIGQHQRLLLEYSDKNKITFEEALKFATVEETAERQAMKGKSSSVNSIKKGGKAQAKNPNQKPAATAKESEKKKCEKCPSYRHKTEDCTSTFCNYCKRWFHTIESCKLNPNSPSYSPTFEAERNKKKPTATVNSIQHAQQQQTGSLMPPPSNLFQERNQLNTPPPQYLPASPSQPAPVTAPLKPQPGPSNQFPEIQDIQELIDIASDSKDHTWSSSLVGDINSIHDSSQLSTESPMHLGFLYYKSNKARGQLKQVLFDTGAIINVIPSSVANLIEANYD